MPLITPITDRTQADVNYARAYPYSSTPNKGAINHTDLNRIESNCEYLASQLNHYGYSVNITVKTNWTMMDFPYQSKIDRIRNNINAIINAYHNLQGRPDIRYWDSLDWNDANSLEQNILNIDIMLQRMAAFFKYSGMNYSGEW